MAHPMLLALVLCLPAFSQAFDVAEVKINKTGPGPTNAQLVNGQVHLTNAPMRLMIMAAYDVTPDAVTGGPGWIDSERYDVVAKANPDATEKELRAMLKTLLVERFKLAAHVDQKMTAAYAMTVAKGGHKLKESELGKPAEQLCRPTDGPPEQNHILCEHITMAQLAKNLRNMAPRYIDLPVVDKTELTGAWAFQLDWTPMASPDRQAHPGEAAIETTGGLTMFDALAKIGLKLEKAKLPVPLVVVDSLERVPVDN
jgi:uncharacterized protein (TIGR03435 family)